MALTRKNKEKLMADYKSQLVGAKNVVVIKQTGIPVNEINQVRMDMLDKGGKFNVIKKRVFLKNASELGLNGGSLDDLEGSVAVLYSYEDEYAPLKVIAAYKKKWEKEKKTYGFDYMGGWFENSWKDKSHVSELANLPTKEEILGKFVYLLNYPLQSFAYALDQISKKNGGGEVVPSNDEAAQ